MIVMPAMELRDGACVQQAGDACGVARGWERIGFRRLHVVDLDAAHNTGSNASLIEEIIRDGGIDVQAGGGVESSEEVQRLFEAGAAQVVVGFRALEDPQWLSNVADLFPGVIVVATAVRERRVATRGWVRSLPLDIFDVIDELNAFPLGGVLISAVNGQGKGSMGAADLSLMEDVAGACEVPVIVAGGVMTMNDLRALEHRGLAGVVVGTALYTGTIDARAAAQEFNE
jgi:phosphoribosylformimino-5-aminoimidazole carboxamide ribotide isomerase